MIAIIVDVVAYDYWEWGVCICICIRTIPSNRRLQGQHWYHLRSYPYLKWLRFLHTDCRHQDQRQYNDGTLYFCYFYEVTRYFF